MDEINPYESPKHASARPTLGDRNGETLGGPARGGLRRRDFVRPVGYYGIALVITALVLDDGTMFRACLAAVIAHWIGMMIIVIRRRTSPTELDVGFVKFGFLFFFFLSIPAGFVVRAVMALR